jgi:hypothetical protein
MDLTRKAGTDIEDGPVMGVQGLIPIVSLRNFIHESNFPIF